MTIYLSYEIDLPEDGIKGSTVHRNYPEGEFGNEDKAFSEYMQCDSCNYTSSQTSIGTYEDPKMVQSFWDWHKKLDPECTENRDVITFAFEEVRKEERIEERKLEEFEDVQMP